MILHIEEIAWRSLDEVVMDDHSASFGVGILLKIRNPRMTNEEYVVLWSSFKGSIQKENFERKTKTQILAWAYLPTGKF